MQINVRCVLVSLMMLAVSGCSDTPTSPRPERGSGIAHVYAVSDPYISGAQAKFSFENNGAEELAYFPCVDYVEQKVGEAWVTTDGFNTGRGAGTTCTSGVLRVPAGAIVSAIITIKIPDNTEAGTYRVVMESVRPANEIQRPEHLVISDAFSIHRGLI